VIILRPALLVVYTERANNAAGFKETSKNRAWETPKNLSAFCSEGGTQPVDRLRKFKEKTIPDVESIVSFLTYIEKYVNT
jgi:oligoendopeptidase F